VAYLFNRVCDTRVELSPTFATYYRHLREFCDREVGYYWHIEFYVHRVLINERSRVGIVSPIRHPTNAFRLLDYRFSIITPRSRRFINLPFFLVIKKKGARKVSSDLYLREVLIDITFPSIQPRARKFHFLAGLVIPFSCGIHSPTSRCDFFHRYSSFEEYCVYFQFLIIPGLSHFIFHFFRNIPSSEIYIKIDFLNV